MGITAERQFICGDHALKNGRFLKTTAFSAPALSLDKSQKEVNSSFAHVFTLEGESDIYDHQYKLIEKAQKSIKLVSFVFDSGPLVEKLVDLLIKKASEDVTVKVFTTLKTNDLRVESIASTEEIDFNSHSRIVRRMADSGIQLRARNDCHGKFCITDGTAALISSANLTDNSYNRNPEFGCVFRDSIEVKKISAMFDHMWKESYQFYVNNDLGEFLIEERLPAIPSYKNLFPFKVFHEDYEIMYTYVETTAFSQKICELIEKTRSEITISSYLVRALDKTPVGTSLLDALARGVRVKIITRPSNHRFDHLKGCQDLVKRGAEIIGNSFNHAKIFSFDSDKAAIFTGNLDGLHGLENGIEFGVLLKNRKYTAFAMEYNRLLEDESLAVYRETVTQKELGKDYGRTITLNPLQLRIPPRIQSGRRTFDTSAIYELIGEEEVRARLDAGQLTLIIPEFALFFAQREDGVYELHSTLPSFHIRYREEARNIRDYLIDTPLTLQLTDG
ncbi:phospholipase D-like domain-containing protein [Mesobacillus jeotgali]|uniref:phospholipase D-like domain-containing protein n=1 Tax=Mesobacillus jeotgali TaxID=129985 RepID=UPI001CFF1111|nr:phospholipase D-like domain-containing protein [Mesobacillus jeotgali]